MITCVNSIPMKLRIFGIVVAASLVSLPSRTEAWNAGGQCGCPPEVHHPEYDRHARRRLSHQDQFPQCRDHPDDQ